MPIRPDMLNGEEFLQGGLFTALADEAMVLAIYPLLGPEERIATISECTTFLSGAQRGVLVGTGQGDQKGQEGDLCRRRYHWKDRTGSFPAARQPSW